MELRIRERRYIHGKLKELERRIKSLENLLKPNESHNPRDKQSETAPPDRSEFKGG